jgi:hypothetical protein
MNHPVLRLFDGREDTSPQLQDDVKELQLNLKRFGFDIQTDGVFGSENEAAVHQFQLDHGLLPDGIVGPQSWAALEETAAPDLATTFPTTISGSNAAMRKDFAEALKFKELIDVAAQGIGVPSVVICGIGSRESDLGISNRPTGPAGTGDFAPRKFPTAFRAGALPPEGGYGRGLMQIDFDAFPFARTGNWQDPEANIKVGCTVLKTNIDFLGRKTSLTGRDLLQAAIAAYNCGAGNVLTAVREGHDVDFFTTGRDYSKDVLSRAGFFQNMGWDSKPEVAKANA